MTNRGDMHKMKKRTTQERLSNMERKLSDTIAAIKDSQIKISDGCAELHGKHRDVIDYLLLPWYRRLITKRPR